MDTRVAIPVNKGLPHTAYASLLLTWLALTPFLACFAQSNSTYYYQRESHFQSLQAPSHPILFVGNSLSDGAEWNELFPGRPVLNRGISGDITSGVLSRLPSLIALQPEKVFLMIGVNDLARDSSVEQVARNYQAILSAFKTQSPHTMVYAQSLLPVNPSFGKFSGHAKKHQEIRALNQRIQQQATSMGYVFVDLHSAFCDSSGHLDARFTNDGLHLNGAGYLHWKAQISHLVYSLPQALPALLPLPRELTWSTQAPFDLSQPIAIVVAHPAFEPEAQLIRTLIPQPLGGHTPHQTILLRKDSSHLSAHSEEAYYLEVRDSLILLEASTAAGIFNGIQTLRQLMQNGVYVPACTIRDWPAFPWRGFMHDVGRNYQTLESLKQQIDILSRYKINVFHLHLTEDIAWRVESKRYPTLTQPENMLRDPGKYYTLSELRALEAFCKSRHVLLIPEMDMPGHSEAFSRATGVDMQSAEGKVILRHLLEEWCDSLEAPVFHIGSDEVHISDSTFVPYVADVLRQKGRKVMGWRPGGNLPEDVIRQLWIGSVQPDLHHPEVDSRHLYLNHLDPFESVATIFHRQIGGMDTAIPPFLGAIGCIWPDRRVQQEADILQMNTVFPALITLAERSWRGGGTPGFRSDIGSYQSSDWSAFREFEDRLSTHQRLYFQALPFPYMPQSDIRWKLLGPYSNNGKLSEVFAPEKKPLDQIPSFLEVSGATIQLRHFWSPLIQSHLKESGENSTIYAWTSVFSPVADTVYLWAGFHHPSLSTATDTPEAGTWDKLQSRIWLNGIEVPAPRWARAGQKGHLEIPLQDESYAYRAPIPVALQPGYNQLLIKAPVASFRATAYHNPVKWMFTGILFRPTSAGYQPLPTQFSNHH